jgi:glutamyl-tRNA(Gln) amidotransferase subunit E
VIGGSLKKGGIVLACLLPGFAGLVGRELTPGRRLGTELSDRAKRAGVGGLFHTDELPAYGITDEDVKAVRRQLSAGENDAVIMVTGPSDRAHKAIAAAIKRAAEALTIVPEETRRALPDGASEYMRPLPGSARMYPETDVPSVVVPQEYLDSLLLPELFTQRSARFEKQYSLNPELAGLMASSPNYQLFEEILRRFDVPAPNVVRTLEVTPQELAKEGAPVENLSDRHFLDVFSLLSEGKLAKEGIPALLGTMAGNPSADAPSALSKAGLSGVGGTDVEAVIRRIVIGKAELVREKGERSAGPLMGLVMSELRGKADGALVNKILKQEIDRLLKG